MKTTDLGIPFFADFPCSASSPAEAQGQIGVKIQLPAQVFAVKAQFQVIGGSRLPLDLRSNIDRSSGEGSSSSRAAQANSAHFLQAQRVLQGLGLLGWVGVWAAGKAEEKQHRLG
ncbi:hypothetical protein [Thermostichus vulcanus]|uniref:Uncharacterized protein n=1 Tax=Thermostichus vulcanus str. 'Rupite' TaxID=2813851 RepID=A0ABT0CDS9_THEVL|nr:hypothetical protein [Thermostichus vulcanus]MCJ2543884.1 hypothetical protein [Thermostichus vulcanus str. 'Rupite']